MKLVIGVTAASGSIYAKRCFERLAIETRRRREAGEEALNVHWVCSNNAPEVWRFELGEDLPSELPEAKRWALGNFYAPFASGSNPPDAVVIIPCSMSTLARIAHGGGQDLLTRSCDVALKERRRLVVVARETPLSLVHLRNMTALTEAGGIMMPAVPSFYGPRANANEQAAVNYSPDLIAAVDTVVTRALDLAGLRLPDVPRWGEEKNL